MKERLWPGLLGIVVLLVGCSNDSTPPDTAQLPSTPAKAQEFANPVVTQSFRPGVVPAVPGLLQPTNAKARANSVAAGRRDPFAAVPSATIPIAVPAKPTVSKVAVAPLPTASGKASGSSKLPSISLPPISMLPSVPLPTLPNSAALPPLTVPGAPSVPIAPPKSLAEAIEVNGVVQVAGKWNVIVKEPSSSSSRYVSVGDYLENGKVLVKKILAAGTTEPVVILQQGGVEIRKSLV